MAATVTGTPVALTFAQFNKTPAAQNLTVPADATAVYIFWQYWADTNGAGLASITLDGNAPSQSFENPISGDASGTGVAVWYSPATGTRAIQPVWDDDPEDGPAFTVVYVKDGDLSSWRDADGASNTGGGAVSFTLTTAAGDLVLAQDSKYSGSPTTPPSLPSGWTAVVTQLANEQEVRTRSISASGATQGVSSEDVDYSGLVGVSIPAAAAPASTFIPAMQTSQIGFLNR